MLAPRLLERHDVQVGERLVAPVRRLLLAHEHERDVEAVVVGEPPRVLDDDADPARELQVVDEEADLHVTSTARRPLPAREAELLLELVDVGPPVLHLFVVGLQLGAELSFSV